VGGATAFHQYHPVEDPPLGHLDDILRNAAVFRQRWGWWPMQGWLAAFEQRGLINYDRDVDRWRRTHPVAETTHGVRGDGWSQFMADPREN
jgi:N-acetylglucosaminyl-diphospho-decaprenol L-rhamnosyltransferase